MHPRGYALAVHCLLVAALAAAPTARAAAPPDLLNYQGILRDPAGTPLDGAYDMVFTFHDAATAGNAILIDTHLQSGSGTVTVTRGLFDVVLGGGAVTDGAGPGIYTSLEAVFNDHDAVWMEIQVGPANGLPDTLSPRIRLVSSAYALDAAKVGGLPAGNFINTSASPQTKAGSLSAQSGLTGNSGAFGVYGVGWGSGGAFANQDLTSIALIGHSGSGYYGLRADGVDAGGFLRDADNLGSVYLGYGDTGVQSSGAIGATLFAQGATGIADLGSGENGIDARGNTAGGFMINTATGGAYATLAGSYGLDASGVYCPGFCGAAGYFTNPPYSGRSWMGIGNTGLYSTGSAAGGEFVNDVQNGHAWLASGDFGVVGNGRYSSISGQGAGGYFADQVYGGWTTLGRGTFGVFARGGTAGGRFFNANGLINDGGWAALYGDGVRGWTDAPHVSGHFYWRDPNNGSTPLDAGVAFSAINDRYTIAGNGLKAFAQNDPTDAGRQVVFVALEGDEAGTYTRGTGRIRKGEARVPLEPAFAAATNPDIGLTALVTPRGAAVPLAVASLTSDAIVVRAAVPEAEGTTFDFAVYGLRLGFESRPAVQAKRGDAPIPPDPAAPPDPSSPLARFAAMRSAAGIAGAPDLARAEALKGAVRRASTPSGPRPSVPAERPEASGRPRTPAPPAIPATSAPPAPLPAGTVAAFDVALGRLVPATGAPEEIVAGIVGAGTFTAGAADPLVDPPLLAPGGSIAFCQADAVRGGIRVGDLLAPSAVPGRARRATDGENGTVVAKALEALSEGSGTIRVLVLSR